MSRSKYDLRQYVTHDLVIAKTAKKIQYEEISHFDNVFIMFGSFYFEMAFFSFLGKTI